MQTRSSKISASLPVRGAWIEMLGGHRDGAAARPSLPVRGAWIEINQDGLTLGMEANVAPRAGSVD